MVLMPKNRKNITPEFIEALGGSKGVARGGNFFWDFVIKTNEEKPYTFLRIYELKSDGSYLTDLCSTMTGQRVGITNCPKTEKNLIDLMMVLGCELTESAQEYLINRMRDKDIEL